jgi:hypothetical protein
MAILQVAATFQLMNVWDVTMVEDNHDIDGHSEFGKFMTLAGEVIFIT